MPYVAEMRKDQLFYNNFTAPGVELHCLYSTNIPTVDRLYFTTEFNPKPIIISGDGDGQVNLRSLLGCRLWENTPAQAGYPIYLKEFKDVNHLGLLYNDDTINYILRAISCDENYSDK